MARDAIIPWHAEMAIEDWYDDFMDLITAVSAEGATQSTLEAFGTAAGTW